MKNRAISVNEGALFGFSAESVLPGTLVARTEKAGVYGKEVVHQAVPASDTMVDKYLGVARGLIDEQRTPSIENNPYQVSETGTALVLVEEGDGGSIGYGDRIAI